MVTSVVVKTLVNGSSLKGLRKPERASRLFHT